MEKVEIRAIHDSEIRDYVETMFWSAGRTVDQQFVEEHAANFEIARALAAFENGMLVGTIGTRSLKMTLPGGKSAPVAAIGQGGVLPSHTRQGIMRRLMLRSMDAAREREEAIAAWTTSEWPLYERYGGGVASFSCSYLIEGVDRGSLREPVAVSSRIRLASASDVVMLLAPLHERTTRRPGGVARNATFWRTVVARLEAGRALDSLESREDLPRPLYCVMRDGDDVLAAACFRIHQNWVAGIPRSELELLFLLCTSSEVEQAMWRFLFGLDLVESIRLPHRSQAEPLRWMLNDGRRLQTTACRDHIWLRLLDPQKALSQRWLPPLDEPIRISVFDPQTQGTSTLELNSDGRETRVEHSSGPPDIELEVGVLASMMLGGVSAWPLAAAGRIRSGSLASLARFESAFAGNEPPFTDNDF